MRRYLFKNLNYLSYRIITSYRRIGRNKFNNLCNKEIIHLKDEKHNLISGYYDINLFSKDEKKILFHRILKNNKYDYCIELCIFDLENNNEITIDHTKLFSLQFGSRLSWFNENIISANTLDKNTLSTTLWNSKNNKIKIINIFNKAIYSWSNNSLFGAVINMKRLAKLRSGYGYNINYDLKTKIPEDDGLEIIDQSSKKIIFFFSLNQICCDEFKDSKYEDYYHYISHLVWNDDSSIIMFDYVITNFKRRFSKLCFFNLKNNKFWYWDLGNTISVSHFTWINSKEFISSSKKKTEGFNFYTGSYNNDKNINLHLTNGDGHPFKYKNDNKILIDTYPNRFSEQTLYDLNLNDNNTKYIATFFSPINFIGANKCDLHPKLSSSGNFIGVDCCFNGKREIIVIKNN